MKNTPNDDSQAFYRRSLVRDHFRDAHVRKFDEPLPIGERMYLWKEWKDVILAHYKQYSDDTKSLIDQILKDSGEA